MRQVWLGLALASLLLAGCGTSPAGVHVATPSTVAAKATQPGHYLYGAFVTATVTQVQVEGQKAHLCLRTTPDSKFQGEFEVNLWSSKPLPELHVGDRHKFFVDYPLTDGNRILRDAQPYSAMLEDK